MTEIEFIEKYIILCDKEGNLSHIKLSERQKIFKIFRICKKI